MPGTAAGTAALKHWRRVAGDVVVGGLRTGAVARQHHVRLEEDALERDPLRLQRGEHGLEHRVGDLVRALDGVRPVLEDLGLHDRHDARFLAQRGVAGQRVGVHVDAVRRRQRVGDRVGGAPLGEPGTERVVLGQTLTQPVEPFGHGLTVGAGQRLRAGVDLDARDDALVGQQLRERRAVGARLADRLVEEDDAADEVADLGSGEQQVAVGAAQLLGRLDADRVEALLDRAGRLVGGQDPVREITIWVAVAWRVSRSMISVLLPFDGAGGLLVMS